MGCASYKGTLKPNWWLADFNKYGEAYYLSTEQIKIGDDKDTVEKEYGSKYKAEKDKKGRDIWIFKSYKATAATDPVQKVIKVEFIKDKVTNISEKYTNGGSQSCNVQTVESRMRQIQRLYADGIISKEEFEIKKGELLKEL